MLAQKQKESLLAKQRDRELTIQNQVKRESAMDDYYKNNRYSLPTPVPAYKNTDAEVNDKTAQKKKAYESLKTIANEDVAFQMIQYLDTSNELQNFNIFFPKFKKALDGISNITANMLSDYWDKYKTVIMDSKNNVRLPWEAEPELQVLNEISGKLTPGVPSGVPSSVPSGVPSSVPSGVPSSVPSGVPSGVAMSKGVAFDITELGNYTGSQIVDFLDTATDQKETDVLIPETQRRIRLGSREKGRIIGKTRKRALDILLNRFGVTMKNPSP